MTNLNLTNLNLMDPKLIVVTAVGIRHRSTCLAACAKTQEHDGRFAATFNLRLERLPNLSSWGSDTCRLHSQDTLCGRTYHRCTCHLREQPWIETHGLKHNRGIELCLSFLTSAVSGVEGFLRALRLRYRFPISPSCRYPVLCHLWPFWFPSAGSSFWVVAFEQLLDALDRAL